MEKKGFVFIPGSYFITGFENALHYLMGAMQNPHQVWKVVEGYFERFIF